MVNANIRLITAFGEMQAELVLEHAAQVRELAMVIAKYLRCDVMCIVIIDGHTTYLRCKFNEAA